MAEALLCQEGGTDFSVTSAGTEPRGVHALTVRVLAEHWIDWSGARSKSVLDVLDQSFDYVITVCDRARQACPVFPGLYVGLHWDIEDPAEIEGPEAVRLAAFRLTAQELLARIVPFVAQVRRERARREPART